MRLTITQILDLDLLVFNRAYEMASEVHKDQKRSDGKPYMTHIDAVIENTYESLVLHNRSAQTVSDMYDVDYVLCVAALHDAVEDHPDKISLEQIGKELTSLEGSFFLRTERHLLAVESVVDAIDAISKKPKGTEAYDKYVVRVAENPYARIVKLADLTHNMSDLKPGNMLDKYQLTYYVLSTYAS